MVMTCRCPGCDNCCRITGWGPKCQQNRAKGEEELFNEQPHLIRCAFCKPERDAILRTMEADASRGQPSELDRVNQTLVAAHSFTQRNMGFASSSRSPPPPPHPPPGLGDAAPSIAELAATINTMNATITSLKEEIEALKTRVQQLESQE